MKLTRTLLHKEFPISEDLLERLEAAVQDALLQNLSLDYPKGVEPAVTLSLTIAPRMTDIFVSEVS